MRGIERGWGTCCAFTGLLVLACVIPLAALAAPIVEAAQPGTQRLEGISIYELEPRPGTGSEAVREALRAGRPSMTPSLAGIDDGFLSNGNLLNSEVLELDVPFTNPVPAGSRRNPGGNGGPELFKEAMDAALQTTRDTFFDGGDTASFSLAGIEMNVTLKGEHRGVSINGYDLLGSSQYVVPQDETWAPPDAQPLSATSRSAPQEYSTGVNDLITLADIRKLVLHPMTIIGAIVLLGVWVLVVLADVLRARRS